MCVYAFTLDGNGTHEVLYVSSELNEFLLINVYHKYCALSKLMFNDTLDELNGQP